MDNNSFDIVICLGPNDKDIILESIKYTKKNVLGYRNIYIVSYDDSITIDGATIIDERIFPFNKKIFVELYGNSPRHGWYIQQLIKLYAGKIIPGILDKYLVIDSDTFFLKPTEFITNECNTIFTTGSEYHIPYFSHMNRLHESLTKTHAQSGISHHCFFANKFLNELFTLIENRHNNNKPFWRIFMDMIDKNEYNGSGASEYELYFTFMNIYYNDKFLVRELKWENTHYLDVHNKKNNQFVSVHWYNRK